MRLTYRPLSPEADWELFKQRPPFSDVVLPPEVALRQILALDDACCSSFWTDVVTPNPEWVWYRDLPQTHWARRLIYRGPDWYQFFDKWPSPDPIAVYLQSRLRWEEEQQVYFVRSKRYVLQTVWSVFLDYWRPFLFSDDDPFLLAVNQAEFVLIGDNGVLAIGERPVPLYLEPLA